MPTEANHASGLDPRTVQLIEELFGGKVCVDCGAQAQRLFNGNFYCADCYATPSDSRHLPGQTWNPPLVKDPKLNNK